MWVDKNHNYLASVRDFFGSLTTHPAMKIVNFPSEVQKYVSSLFRSHDEHKKEIFEANKENLRLTTQVRHLERQVAEFETHKQFHLATKDIKEKVELAEIFNVELDPDRQQVKINKGTTDCAYVDQAAIDAHGILGQVIETTLYHSTVRLVTDQAHQMPVQFKRTGMHSLAVGTGESKMLKLPHLPTSEKFEIGDEIITSGLGGVYPYGYKVGVITQLEDAPNKKFKIAYVKPAALVDRAREVLLVWYEDPNRPRKPPTGLVNLLGGAKPKCQ